MVTEVLAHRSGVADSGQGAGDHDAAEAGENAAWWRSTNGFAAGALFGFYPFGERAVALPLLRRSLCIAVALRLPAPPSSP